jgi:hypothetical protein
VPAPEELFEEQLVQILYSLLLHVLVGVEGVHMMRRKVVLTAGLVVVALRAAAPRD